MNSTLDLDVQSRTIKQDGNWNCPVNELRTDFNRDEDEEEEVDPNLYGEDIPNLVHDKPVSPHRPSSPVSPLPTIKPEPEVTTIKREQQILCQPVNNDIIPPAGEDEPGNSLALEDSLQVLKPRKRRQLTPEVLLYTWKDLQRQRQKDFEKIKKMNNPIVKKPKNIEFSLSSLYDRLKTAGLDPFEVTLDPDIRDQPVSRAFMSSVYGGGSQDTFPSIGPLKLAEHGIENFMYVNASLHTHGPQWPGNPGLFFTSKVDGGGNGDMVYKTFVRLDAAKWMYVGDYILFRVPPLSKEEWNFMTVTVRNAWVSYIMKKSWGIAIRARVIARRELGRKPTVLEWQRVFDEGRSSLVTPPEIHAALEAGHEQLGIYVMKCVGYDEAFQRQLVERFGRWIPPAPKRRGERRGQPRGNVMKLESDSESKPKIKQEMQNKPNISRTPLKSRKRKRQSTPKSDAELSLESEDLDLGNELQEDKHYKKKLRQNMVVKRQEDDTLFGPSDYDESEDEDSKPDIEIFSNGSQLESQISTKQRNSGTRADPIIL